MTRPNALTPRSLACACALLALLLGCDPPTLTYHDLEPTPDLQPPALPLEPEYGLVINEVMTRNQSTIMDATAVGGDLFPDWIELYHGGTEPIDLSRLVLRDRSDNAWAGMPGQLLPGEHLLLWADGTQADGHLPFRLAGDGDNLTLLLDGQVLDRVATGQMDRDTSWARFPDGGEWALTIDATPGWNNGLMPSATTDPSDALFQRQRILDFHITLPQASYDSLDDNPRVWVPGSLAFAGAYFADVEVRLKGRAGSRRDLDEKCAVKVDLNDLVPGQGIRGINKLTFNNMVQDPSYVHEFLAYTIYRAAGLPAPRIGWSRLYINDEYFGLYLLIESVDDKMLERWYTDASGHLFEGAYGTDFEVAEVWDFEYDQGPDPDDRSDLLEAAYILEREPTNAAIQDLRNVIDLDQFIMNMAIESLILHWDGYTTSNNYRVYHDPVTDLFQIIPWGTDQTFDDYWYMPYEHGNGRSVVFQFCLANTDCRAQYSQALADVADLVDQLDLLPVVDELQALLYDDIVTDPRREHSLTRINNKLHQTRQTLQLWPDQVREQIEP